METKTNIKVRLIGEDGNAFNIIGKVNRALRSGGRSDLIKEYTTEAASGDYNNLLCVTQKYVIVE